MSNLKELRKEAKELGISIGKLTTHKDSDGEYTLYEYGSVVAEGYFGSATEIKEDYIQNLINNSYGKDF